MMRILRRSLALAPMACLVAVSLAAQVPAPASVSGASTVSVPPSSLLPEHFGSWAASEPAGNAIHFDDAVAKELLLQRMEARKYTAGAASATVSAMQLADATGAYSAWTLLRSTEMRPCAAGNAIGKDCAVSPGKLLFWQGNTLVQISPSGAKPVSAEAFSDLAASLPKPLGAKGAPPLLPTRLPQSGLNRNSIRYAVGPATYAAAGGVLPAGLLDFTKSPEILLARYGGSAGNGLLTAVFYPTPTIAGRQQHILEAALQQKSLPSSMQSGIPAVHRSGPILALASSGFSKKQAEKLVGAVRYEAEVTWNKPEGYMDQFTISRTSNVMVQIIILVITVVLAALVLGVVFGGGRALLRKTRGKPVSSLDDMEIIRLDLRGPAPKIRS